MRLIYSVLLSLLIIFICYGILIVYGQNKSHKERQHELLTTIEGKVFHKDPSLWDEDGFLPYIEIFEKDNTLAFKSFKASELPKYRSDFKTGVLMEIVEDSKNINVLLNQFIIENRLEEKVLIASRFKNVVENIRRVKPRWLTSISSNDLYIAIVLKKMFLESLAPLKGDFLLVNESIIEKKWWSEIPMRELQKRNKAILSAKEGGYFLEKTKN